MTTTDLDRATAARQNLVTGLHELADYLAANPSTPTGLSTTQVTHFVRGEDDASCLARLAEIAAAIGTDITCTDGGPVTADTTHFHAVRHFGPVSYQAIYITRSTMADYDAWSTYRNNIRADRPEVAA